jgi:hypothetical protein
MGMGLGDPLHSGDLAVDRLLREMLAVGKDTDKTDCCSSRQVTEALGGGKTLKDKVSKCR